MLRELRQRSPTGVYESSGFQATCLDKVAFILDALAKETDPFLFSDVDVRFYGPVVEDLTELLGDADMAFQWDGPRGRECSGFMALRPSVATDRFWRGVYYHMTTTGAMDQDALHAMLRSPLDHIRTVVLPERYWTCGLLDKVWNPGDAIDPPADLLMHHANWTVGVDNKMELLQSVKEHKGKPEKMLEQVETEEFSQVLAAIQDRASAAIPAVVKSHERTFTLDDVHRIIEDERNKLAVWHNPMPLALVLQFWKGDKHEACELARMLADCEPTKRTDVGFIFARQENCQLDEELYETQLYVGEKFSVSDLVAEAPTGSKYPGVCARAWGSAARQLADAYLDGRLPYHSAFFFEADGGPLPPLRRWIDRIKNAHQETLSFGKMFTGARMRERDDHLNGTLVMDLRAIVDIPSLSRCPGNAAWDIFHGPVLVRESHPTNIIRNEYGISLTDYAFRHLGREAAWITSIKDGTHHHFARQILAKERRTKGDV